MNGIVENENLQYILQNIVKTGNVKSSKGMLDSINPYLYEFIAKMVSRKVLTFPKYENVVGPIIIQFLKSSIYNKNIILLGDYHPNDAETRKTIKCQSASGLRIDTLSFIQDLIIKNKDKPIDIFIENGAYSTFTKHGMYVPKMYSEMYNDEMTIVHDGLKYTRNLFNYRLHDIDQRPEKLFVSALTSLLSLEGTDEEMKDLYESIILYNNITPADLYAFTIRLFKIDKQLKKIRNVNVLRELHLLLFACFEMIQDIHYNFDSDIYRKYRVLFTDVYCMARVFNEQIQSDNIIIFTGGLHTKNYAGFLERLNFNSVFKNGSTADEIMEFKNSDFKCVNVSGLPVTLLIIYI
jgi:hypothetical protein